MTNPTRFVASRQLAGIEFVQFGDHTLVESAPRLRAALQQRVGSEVALLFAEPILSRGNGSAPGRLDWYTERTGAARPLGELTQTEADAVRARFAELAGRILPLLSDPDVGFLAAAAFNLLSRDSLVAVDGEPLVIDWGILPQPLVGDAAALARHHAETIGGLVPAALGSPPLDGDTWATRFQHVAAPPPPSARLSPDRTGRLDFSSPNAAAWTAAALLGGLLALSYVPGVLAFPQSPDVLSREAGFAQAAWLEGLQRRHAALQAAIDLDCPRLGQDLPGLIPPRPRDVRVSPDPGARTRATVVPLPQFPSTNTGSTTPPGSGDLVDVIERATVLVLAGSASGSGFFVSNELLVTNRHVVESGGRLLVAGRHVGVLEATLIHAGGGGTLQDFAVLRVPRQSGVTPMPLAAAGRPLTPVVAAGFPGLHLATDPIFQRLREGDADASRSLEPVFQTGVVNHLQPQAEGVTLVVHGAEIAPGNSGGPLVDYCGRVVGVNTFGRTDARLPITARYALGTDGLAAFLRATGMTISIEAGPCVVETPSFSQGARNQSSAPTIGLPRSEATSTGGREPRTSPSGATPQPSGGAVPASPPPSR